MNIDIGFSEASLFGVCSWWSSPFLRTFSGKFGLSSFFASVESSDFEGYIVLDTQMIVGGKHAKYRFTIDDYCFDRASVPFFFGSETLVLRWEIHGKMSGRHCNLFGHREPLSLSFAALW